MDETDNENEMVIDIRPNTRSNAKNKSRGRKRKRISSSSSNEYVLPENTLEVEKNLHASAVKNNLDDASVKKILKKVVTNDHVLALMKLREEEESSSTDEDVPTLTRSKAKTVKKVPRVTAPWNLQLNPIEHIPVKTRPEVEALIAQELPDDEDDEEYEPTNDDIPSDDDHILESCSDLDSQPRTPATPKTQSDSSPKIVKDGPFKVPQVSKACRQLHLEEEATIALRTRSKLSLSSTPIEHIEGLFVPPDDLPVTDVDEIWSDFLQECLDPAAIAKHEDDDETDPEYNVAADLDANEDEEGLEKSIIKISKKELEDILTELCQVIPGQEAASKTGTDTAQDTTAEVPPTTTTTPHWDGKREVVSDEEQARDQVIAAKVVESQSSTRVSIGKSEPPHEESGQEAGTQTEVPAPAEVRMAVEVVQMLGAPGGGKPAVVQHVTTAPAEVVHVNIDDTVKFLPEQILLLKQQLRQHVQLVTSSFLQLCVHPTHWARAPPYRQYLESLNSIADARPSSVVNVCNLRPALELIGAYESSVREVTKENAEMVAFIADEMEKMQSRSTHKHLYRGQFPELFLKVVSSSSVFLYPYLLPPSPFRPTISRKRFGYLRSEDELIALGLDQFWWYVEHNPSLFKSVRPKVEGRGRRGLLAATQLVCKHMMPWMPTKTLTSHISVVRKTRDPSNPINKFLKNRTVEPVKHKLLPFNPKLTLFEQPEHEMPRTWLAYLAKTSKRFKSYLYRRTHMNGLPPPGVDVDLGKDVQAPEKTPLPVEFTQTYTNQRVSNGYNKNKPSDETQQNGPTVVIESHVFNVVNTKNGVLLVPAPTNTVCANSTPICTPAQTKPKNTITIDSGRLVDDRNVRTSEIRIMKKPECAKPVKQVTISNEAHCKCCVLLKKICKSRQTAITEYLQNNKLKIKPCACSEIRYPKTSNRLKLLFKYYWTFSRTVYNKVKSSLEGMTVTLCNKSEESDSDIVNDEKDIAYVISFILKLTIRMNMSRTLYSKSRINELLSDFDVLTGNPLHLAADLHKLLDSEDLGLYKEFIGFLTPDQADRLEKFHDYFIANCMEGLIKKIEDTVPDLSLRRSLLERLQKMFTGAAQPACDACCELLRCLSDYPQLAAHTFSLFPHRRKHTQKETCNAVTEANTNTSSSCNIERFKMSNIETSNINMSNIDKNNIDTSNINTSNIEEVNTTRCDVEKEEKESAASSVVTADDEGEEASSEESSENEEEFNIKEEPSDIDEITITETEVQHSSRDETDRTGESDMPITKKIDEDIVKNETLEWKREEDKLILEIVKQSLSEDGVKAKSISAIIDSKSEMFSECFVGKSLNDIKQRLFDLLQFVNKSE